MSESEGTVDGTGLPWGGSSSSRVGSQFQVDYLPSPDEYASVSTSSGESARGTASSSTTSTRRTRCDDEVPGLDQIWDPSLAREKGVLDFVHTYVTPSLKEHAIEILHKNNYNSIGIMKELESATPLDGSDWKVKEHDSFLRLMLATEHDVNRVARRMKKSVANCLTVYYKIVNVKCHEVPSGSRRKRISTDGNPELVEVDLKIIKSDVFMSTKKRRKRKTREGKQDTQQPVLKSNKTLPNSMPSAVPSENDSAGSQLKNANEGDESKVKGISKREQRMKRRFRARSDNSEKDMIEPISSMSDIDAKPSSVGADDVPQGSEAKTAHNTADRSHDICSSYLGTKNGCETSYTKDNGTDLISMQIKNDARIKHTSNAQSDGFASTVIATATAVATEARATRNVKNPSAFETEEQEKNGARTRQIINLQSDGVDSTVITTATAVATEACPALGVMNPVVAEPKESKDGEEQEQEQEQEKNDSSTRQTINTQSDGVASIVITTAVAIEEPEESTDSDSIVKSATILETNNADTMKLLSFITDGRHSSVSTTAKPQAKDEGGTPISEPSTGRGQYLEKSGSGEDGPRNKAIRGYTTRSARKQKFVGPSYESDLKLALKVDLEWNANESELDQPCYKSNKSLNNLAPRSLRKSRRDALVTDSLDSETRRSSRIIKDNALSAESKPGATQNPTKAITNRNQRSRGYSKASTQTSSIESTRKKSSENENKSDPSNVISDPSQPGKRIRRKSRETSTTARASSNIPINYSTTLSNPRERSSNRKKDKASESLPNKPDTLEECHGIKKRRSKRSKLQQQQDQRRQHDAYPNTGDWFEERFSTLEEYTQTHGHCLVPKIFPENQALSYWVFRIRSLYKEKMKKSKVMKSRLTDEQVKRLEEIGFQFYVKGADNQLKFEAERRKPKDDVRWDSYMKMLKAYKEKHGDCLVPKVHAPNQALSTWVFAQRQQKRFFDKKVHNRLTEEKVLELEDIGFIWRAKTNKEWQEKDRQRKQEMLSESWKIHFKRLCAYKQKHGHTRVPKNYPTDRSLSSWVFRQRGYHKKFDKEGTRNDLEIEREQKLESIGFEFSVRMTSSTREGKPSKSIACTQQVIKENGNDSAPTDPSKGRRKSRKRSSEEAQNQDTNDPKNRNDSAPAVPAKGNRTSRKRSSEVVAQNQDTTDDPKNENDNAPAVPSMGNRKYRKRSSEEAQNQDIVDPDNRNDSAPTDSSKGTEISSGTSSEEEAQNQDPTDDPDNRNDSALTDPSKGTEISSEMGSEEEAQNQDPTDDPDNRNDSALTDPSKGTEQSSKMSSEEMTQNQDTDDDPNNATSAESCERAIASKESVDPDEIADKAVFVDTAASDEAGTEFSSLPFFPKNTDTA